MAKENNEEPKGVLKYSSSSSTSSSSSFSSSSSSTSSNDLTRAARKDQHLNQFQQHKIMLKCSSQETSASGFFSATPMCGRYGLPCSWGLVSYSYSSSSSSSSCRTSSTSSSSSSSSSSSYSFCHPPTPSSSSSSSSSYSFAHIIPSSPTDSFAKDSEHQCLICWSHAYQPLGINTDSQAYQPLEIKAGVNIGEGRGEERMWGRRKGGQQKTRAKRAKVESTVEAPLMKDSGAHQCHHHHHSGLRQTFMAFTLAVFAALTSSVGAFEIKPMIEGSKITLAGLTARMPCDLPLPEHRPNLILWYKDGATKPFYSFDARESPSGHHKVPDSSELGRRSRFHLENYPRSYKERLGYLEVEEITLQDSGNYTCRVDFATSKTMMALLHLTVHQAIEDLNIYDENQTEISQEAGPYNQGTTVILSCVPTGGFPTPRVTWTSNGVVVARSSPTSRVAILKIPMIQREDNKRKFTCTASSTNLTKAVSEDVTISMNLPPLEVEIVGLEEPMTSGKERMLLCRSWGSQPAAYLDITADGPTKPIKFHQQSNLDSNVTLAKVRFLPVPEDDGKTLTCTATNPAVRSYKSSKTKTIVVHYAPEVHAQLALALDPKNIKEEDDAYIECKVKANPPPHKIIWYHNGVEVRANKEEGVILHAHDLVLQKVTRKQRGNYQCRAVNTINTTLSENVRLNIMYVPECKEPANVTHSVSPTEEVELSCEVDSYPEQVEFTWALNSTQSFTTLDEHRYQENGLRSTVRYKASNHDQYGVLFCWATNQLGRQTQPCLFIITPAGPPEALVSCSLANQSNTFLGVTCKPGHDGGLRQHFVAKVIDEITQNEVANVTSEVPEFELRGLAPGRDYLVVVTAVNAKGSSRPYILEGFALKVAENKINDTSSSDSSPLLAVFIGVVSGFVFILTILVFVTRAHCRRRPARSNADAEEEEEEKAKGVDKVLSHDELRSPGESSGEGGGEEPPPMAESPGSTLQTEESPTTTRTYVPSASYGSLPHPTRPHQPLHSVGLPNVTSNNHKYYTLKINCTRQSNESFV